jgi:hypothetical protein
MNIQEAIHHSIKRGEDIMAVNDPDPSQEYEAELIMQCILRDLRHYAKHAGVNFAQALVLSRHQFEKEQKEYEEWQSSRTAKPPASPQDWR